MLSYSEKEEKSYLSRQLVLILFRLAWNVLHKIDDVKINIHQAVIEKTKIGTTNVLVNENKRQKAATFIIPY